jgi:hypothetical protein
MAGDSNSGSGESNSPVAELLERVVRRETDPATAAGELLERAGTEPGG